MIVISIILFISYIVSGTVFERIQKYELVHLNLQEVALGKSIEFDAFNHHYHVELEPNHDLNPALTDFVTDIEDGYDDYPILNETCHYHGTVLDSADSSVAISICPREGIKGSIVAFNEEIEIAPTRFYFDPHHHHTAADQHLIFKLSDYDEPIDMINEQYPHIPQYIFNSNHTYRRKLLGSNVVEHYILADNNMYNEYKSDHGSSYKSYLESDLRGLINKASSIYGKNTFQNGDISLSLKKVEAATSSDRSPRFEYVNANFLRNFKSWLSNNKGSSHYNTYDVSFVYTSKSMEKMGWASNCAICKKAAATMTVGNGRSDISSTTVGRVHAHELGHLFGAVHDGQRNSCSGKLMQSKVNGDYFSTCSIDEIADCWRKNNNMQCLGGGSGNNNNNNNYNDNNYNDDNNNNYNDDTNNNYNNGNSGSSSGCLKISGLTIKNGKFNTEWQSNGKQNGYTAYKMKQGSTFHLFSANDPSYGNYWVIHRGSSNFKTAPSGFDWDNFGYCKTPNVDIWSCNNDWSSDSTVQFNNCGAFESLVCLEGNPKTLCVEMDYNGAALWDMQLEETDCLYNKAIYYYYDDDTEKEYYLHYDEYYKYDTDTELSERWVISDNNGDTNSFHIAFCEETELSNCDGKWMVIQDYEDVSEYVRNEDMVINEDCVVNVNDGVDVEALLIALVIVFIIVIIFIAILFIWWKRRTAVYKKNMEIVMDEEEAEEIEEVEVALPTDTTR